MVGFLDQAGCIGAPCESVGQLDPQESVGLHIDAEVVIPAPVLQTFHLQPVVRLIIVGDADNYSCVICKLHYLTA